MATLDTRRANDLFRYTLGRHELFQECPGRVLVTPLINELRSFDRAVLVNRVRHFKDFDEANELHDFGAVKSLSGEPCFFAITCYDPTMEWASEDPTDLAKTVRVLTIMHSSEY